MTLKIATSLALLISSFYLTVRLNRCPLKEGRHQHGYPSGHAPRLTWFTEITSFYTHSRRLQCTRRNDLSRLLLLFLFISYRYLHYFLSFPFLGFFPPDVEVFSAVYKRRRLFCWFLGLVLLVFSWVNQLGIFL